MLLFIGDPNDLTTIYVSWLAELRDVVVTHLPEQKFGVDWWMNAGGDRRCVELEVNGAPVSPDDVQGVFVRFNPEPPIPDGWTLSAGATELFIQERRAAISELIEQWNVPIVNRPSAGRSNGAKPLHMAHLARLGFQIPEWIATSDPDAARRFIRLLPRGAVVKASSGLRSHVRLADDEYLQRVSRGTTPSILQRFIPGYEVRVHVVGQRTFASRIDADAVDYRFDEQEVVYRAVEIPDAVGALCVKAAAHDGLTLAGLDFRVDVDGNWWCLEMNPVPTFLPYEASSGSAIGDAVLDVLLRETCVTRHRSLLAAMVRERAELLST